MKNVSYRVKVTLFTFLLVVLAAVTMAWSAPVSAFSPVLVKDIFAGTSSSYPYCPTAGCPEIGGVKYFIASSPNDVQLWKTDGTTAGTVLVKDIGVGSVFTFAQFGTSKIVFDVVSTDASLNGAWLSDGTTGGTTRVLTTTSNGSNYRIAVSGTKFYLLTSNSVTVDVTTTVDTELWVYDDVAHTATSLEKITSTTGDAIWWVMPTQSTTGAVYMTKTGTSPVVFTLKTTDGTVLGTSTLSTWEPASDYIDECFVGNNVVFQKNVTTPEVWMTDGTVGGTAKLVDGYLYSYANAPQCGAVVGSDLYTIRNVSSVLSFAKINLTTKVETTLIPSLEYAASIVQQGSYVYTVKYVGISGYYANRADLVRTDGTLAGTTVVKSTITGTNAPVGAVYSMARNGRVFFEINEMGGVSSANAKASTTVSGESLMHKAYKPFYLEAPKAKASIVATQPDRMIIANYNPANNYFNNMLTVTTSSAYAYLMDIMPNNDALIHYNYSTSTVGGELYKVQSMPLTLLPVYHTFGRWKYNSKVTNASLRAGDMMYIKNFDASKLRVAQVFLYSYTKKGNETLSVSWKSGTSAFVKTAYNLPTGRKYAIIVKFQDRATGLTATKYFVLYL